jgi:cell division protein FtsI/penicillin-binding protein 2
MSADLGRRGALSLTGLLCLALAASGCTLPFTGPDADDAAHRLARALTKGDLKGVPVVGGATTAAAAYDEITSGVPEATVTVDRTRVDGSSATVSLTWKRRIGGQTWSYDTTAALREQKSGGEDVWAVRWTPALVEKSLQDGEKLSTTTLRAKRGDILGADDTPLVTLRPVLRVGIDKSGVAAGAAATSARSLGQLVGVDGAALAAQVAASGPKAFVQAIVYRRDDVPDQVLARISRIQGARAISDQLPLAPSKDFASAILGTVGPATAELVKASKGRAKAGDDVGISGLEKRYDEQLFGTSGAQVVAVDDRGVRRTLFTAAPTDGAPLRTTLDPQVQAVAQEVLSGVGPASALVAIQPSTGRILAAASGPGSKGYNTATYGRYAPGSTFKVVSSLALLRAGLSPSTPVPCTATTVVDGKTFKNYSDYPAGGLGRIPLRTALANSCNTAFISQRGKVGADGLEQAAAALGLGQDHDLGFPAFFGQVGRPESQTQAAASMIGQGTVLASPMAMATVVASVLKGSAVVPVLLPDQKATPATPATPLTGQEAATLRTMMRGVVENGSASLLRDVRGGPVIAKTGTAEYGDTPPLPTHAWMVAGRGDLAVAVFVEKGDSGSGTAGPVIKAFLQSPRVP